VTDDATDASDRPAAWGPLRSKTVSWFDPMITAAAGADLSGLEQLRRVIAAELPPPPIAALFGFRLVSAEPGTVVFAGEPDESSYNPIGLVHGGFVCTLLDSVIGCAVQSTLPVGVGYTSIEIKVNYLRGLHAHTGTLRARGWVTKPGRRVAFADGEVRDTQDKLIATATGSCLVFPLQVSGPAA
jgi:uncharacterized protein (TIGR00369 family)